MARVTGKYDIKFQRGPSAFSQLLDQYTGIRQKRGREQYLLRLKQASPKNAYERLRDARRGKAKLLQEYAKAMRPTGSPGSVRESFRGSKLPAQFIEQNKDFADQYKRGLGQKSKRGSELQSKFEQALRTLNQEVKLAVESEPRDLKRIETARNDFKLAVRTLYREVTQVSGRDRLRGFSEGVTKAIQEIVEDSSGNINKLTRGYARNDIKTLIDNRQLDEIDPELLETYKAGRLDETQKMAVANDMRGTTSRRASTQMSAADRKTIQDFYEGELEKYDEEITQARKDFEDAKIEYERLLRGPDVNLALAPVAFRPSRVGDRIERFGDIAQSDPGLAQGLVDAEFEDFNPYEDLKFLPNAAGKSQIDIIVDSTKNLERIFGGIDGRGVTAADVTLVQQETRKLADVFNSQIFNEQDFGKIQALGKTYNTKEFIKLAPDLIDKAKNDQQKTFLAQQVVDALRNYEGSLSEDRIRSLQSGGKPTDGLAIRIDETLKEKNYLDETGDTKPLRQSLSNLYNDVVAMPAESRGQVGDSLLLLLEQFNGLPETERDYGTLAFRLENLTDTAKGIEAEDTLGRRPMDLLPSKREMQAFPKDPEPGQVKTLGADISEAVEDDSLNLPPLSIDPPRTLEGVLPDELK